MVNRIGPICKLLAYGNDGIYICTVYNYNTISCMKGDFSIITGVKFAFILPKVS